MRVKLIGGAEVLEAGGTLATLLVDGGKDAAAHACLQHRVNAMRFMTAAPTTSVL